MEKTIRLKRKLYGYTVDKTTAYDYGKRHVWYELIAEADSDWPWMVNAFRTMEEARRWASENPFTEGSVKPLETMRELCKRFERMYPGQTAHLDEIECDTDYVKVYIEDPELNVGSWYTFESCDDFKAWMDDVVMD